ncbi:MAG: hypothetical protein JWO06_2568 [Bacteroidota bacterium]|nr:hypothetical protein [Bacteroidota bacterium]
MFVAIPLLILSLAAGVYLLIKVTKEYLGGIFKVLAWLVIILSLLAIAGVVFRGVHHFHRMHQMQGCGMHEYRLEERMIIRNGEASCCGKDSACAMMGCKMEGDSMVMDRAACEKAMGKDACDKMFHERGRCIISKEECMKICEKAGGEKAEANACPMHKEGKACCMDKAG